METNKIRIMLLMLISLFSALFFYIVIFWGSEKIEKPKNTLSSANSELNNEKIEVNTNSQILFETKDFIVYGKIKRNKQVFTQGLFFDTDDTIIESGGLYGQSVLQKFKLDTPDQKIFKIPLESKYFAEGACLLNNKVYQLTWKERVMYVKIS
jgi:glutamine cyclotransferase